MLADVSGCALPTSRSTLPCLVPAGLSSAPACIHLLHLAPSCLFQKALCRLR